MKKSLFVLLIILAIVSCKKKETPDVCQSCTVKYTDQVNGNVRTDSNSVVLCNDERLNAINTELIIMNTATGHNELKQTFCK